MSELRAILKKVWERLPFAAEMEWYWFKKESLKRRSRLNRLYEFLEDWLQEADQGSFDASIPPKKILMFSMLPIWMFHSAVVASTLYGMGQDNITLAYLPHEDWFTEQTPHQLKFRNLQLGSALSLMKGKINTVSWYKIGQKTELPADLHQQIIQVTDRDFQYTNQVEEVDTKHPFYKMRKQNNLAAARAAYFWLPKNRPDVLVVPNGLILEFGAIFEVAKYLDIPTITYEFGEQRDRIWLTQDQPVMLQDTSAMWAACKDMPFTELQQERIKKLYASRQQAGLWQNFARQWQDVPTRGGGAVREALGLDQRPLVLLAANVVGDSLTLGRQVFSESMTEWIERTLAFFKDKEEIQFVLRIHPGERYTEGPSVEDIVRQILPDMPGHFRIIAAKDPVNTYDLIAAADLGIVYTTTVGMEMAMFGLPALVVGKTHYRGKGFTHDPASWDQYFEFLETILANKDDLKLDQAQIKQAWKYAYNFFFEYPRPFPWHLRYLVPDLEKWPVSNVLTEQGMQSFLESFKLLLGEDIPWKQLVAIGEAEEEINVSG